MITFFLELNLPKKWKNYKYFQFFWENYVRHSSKRKEILGLHFYKTRNVRILKDITVQLAEIPIINWICLYRVSSLCCGRVAGRLTTVWGFCIFSNVTGRFWTSCLQTSHVLFPLMLNHFTAQSWWASASSPLQLHSNLRVSPPSPSSMKQILQTASSSGISSPSSPLTVMNMLQEHLQNVSNKIFFFFFFW